VSCSDSQSISSADTADSVTTAIVPDTTLALAAETTIPMTTSTLEVATTVVSVTTVPLTVPLPLKAECSAAAPSTAAISVVATDGDWNGDGTPDTATSWAEPATGGFEWFIRAEVTGGIASSVALGDLGVGYAAVMDGVDVDYSLGAPDGSNKDEILAVVGVASSGYLIGVLGLDDSGCAFQFDDGAGSLFRLATTGTIGQLSGMRCEGAAGSQFLVKLEASSLDEATWDTSDSRIRREGSRSLVLDAPIVGSLAAADPALVQYGQANCGGYTYFDEFNDGGGDY
jgi:hypothetical protein